MVKQIFKAGFKDPHEGIVCNIETSLAISEMFYDTIQGEGVFAGVPATFLRLQGCVLNCHFCDSSEVWRQGQRVNFQHIFQRMEEEGVIERLRNGHHLILTGGSPLKQQNSVISFIDHFIDRYKFKPFIEIENESVLLPKNRLFELIDFWNNSPKLNNSQNDQRMAYKTESIEVLSLRCKDLCWKFVIAEESDWEEIRINYISKGIIDPKKIVLMPCGATREELSKTREIAINLAIQHNVRFMDRLHVIAWDKKTGV